MFWQQILQLSDAFIDPVTSLLFDEAVRQLVGLLKTEINRAGEILAARSRSRNEEKCRKTLFSFTLLSSPRFMALRGLYTYMGKSILRGESIRLLVLDTL